MMSKVIHLSTSLNTKGGISTVISEYIDSEFWKNWNCIHIATHMDKSISSKVFYFIKSIFLFLKEIFSTDIVHLHFSESTSAKRKLFFLVLSWLLRKKRIIHFHSYNKDSTIYSNPRLYYALFYLSDKIIVLSERWRGWILEKWPNFKNKISIIYNPTKINMEISLGKKNQVLFTGALNQRKGYQDLIYAFKIVSQIHKDWILVIAGDGELVQAKSLVSSLELEDNITFVSWVSGETKVKLYKESKIFCLPSYAEGFPMSIIEACSFELAIICTPVGGIPDILTSSLNCIMVEPGNIDKISNSLLELMENEEVRLNLSKNAYKIAKLNFDINSISKQIDIIYNKLIH